MRKIIVTSLFKQDLKRVSKRNRDLEKLSVITTMLVNDIPLQQKHKPHKLVGNNFPKWECHIEPDWLLIYEIKDNSVILYRTGTHSDLF